MQVEKTKKRVGNNHSPTPTKLLAIINDQAKAVSSTKGTTMQVEKTKKQVGNNCNPPPTMLPAVINGEVKAVSSTKGGTMQFEKDSSKKRAANHKVKA
jgi:hypothetical protein